jgi:uncharacterized membrane-anchored protein
MALQGLRNLLSLRSTQRLRTQEAGTETVSSDADSNQALYLTPGNLTFPGVTVAAGAILNFVATDSGGTRLVIAAIIAFVFGSFITYLGLSDSQAHQDARSRTISVFVGVINTALLWISIYGVSSI